MSINPLPQFEADLAEHLKEKEDREAYEQLNAPTSMVVRFGYLQMVGEFPYSGKSKPGCGSKLVVTTHRGTEIGEMLTSTCKNSGCSKSVTRKEMLEYIENSGGRQYPFHDRGRVLRIATVDDLNEQRRQEQWKNELRMIAKGMVEEAGLAMNIIEAEPMLGNERVVFYFGADERVDFRDLVQELQKKVGTKVELRQIGARDEARITADYERCGQYCCCKNFLKVLKPVSMKSAKIQKATLDPLKISGRCGRLMCCLRYEDETYEELRKNLPHRKSRVGSPEGDGIVISTQILTQLALIRLDNGTDVAIAIEELTEPESKTAPERGARSESSKRGTIRSGQGSKRTSDRSSERTDDSSDARRSRGGSGSKKSNPENPESGEQSKPTVAGTSGVGDRTKKKKKKRRRRKPSGQGTSENPTQEGKQGESGDDTSGNPSGDSTVNPSSSGQSGSVDEGGAPKKKRRRRRRRGGGGTEGSEGSGGSGPGNDSGEGSGGGSTSGSD